MAPSGEGILCRARLRPDGSCRAAGLGARPGRSWPAAGVRCLLGGGGAAGFRQWSPSAAAASSSRIPGVPAIPRGSELEELEEQLLGGGLGGAFGGDPRLWVEGAWPGCRVLERPGAVGPGWLMPGPGRGGPAGPRASSPSAARGELVEDPRVRLQFGPEWLQPGRGKAAVAWSLALACVRGRGLVLGGPAACCPAVASASYLR